MREKRYRKTLIAKADAARARAEEALQEEIRRAAAATVAADPRRERALERVRSAPAGASSRVRAGVRSLREATLFDPAQPVQARIDTLDVGKLPIGVSRPLTLRVLRLIGDPNEPEALRVAALNAFRAATFATRATADWRPVYLETLRRVAQNETNRVAERALHFLAQEQDPWAIQTLQNSVRQPERGRMAPLPAVQHLAPEDHGDHFDALRKLASSRRGQELRVEAIRGLAADPGARDLLIELLDNPKEPAGVRQAALLSLRVLDHEAYMERATRIVEDPGESSALRAAAITALRLDTDPADSALTPAIRRIGEEASSRVLRQAAQLYLAGEE
jgi:hypothetical protein